jgi:alkylation response protein AidB-like acyl-CoA dehydrogenase
VDFQFNEKEELFRKSMAEFAQREIAPLVDKMEKEGALTCKLIPKLSEMGILGLITPTEFGGSGMGHVAKTIAMEEISKVYPGVGLTLEGHFVCIHLIQQFGSNEQKKKYLPILTSGSVLGSLAVTEPSGGSDVTGIKTMARKKDGLYYLKGRKCFISNAHVANIHAILSRTGDNPRDFAVFIVEKAFPGFCLGREEKKMGLRGATTGEIILEDCQVPEENLLGNQAGKGLQQILSTINQVGRPGMAAVAVGICYASLTEAAKLARERVLYGNPISNLQAIQFLLAEIFAEAEAARLLTYRAASMADNGEKNDIEATMAKYWACEAAFKCARKAAEIYGEYSTIKRYPVERLLRDAYITIPSSGTAQVAKMVLGKHVTKKF